MLHSTLSEDIIHILDRTDDVNRIAQQFHISYDFSDRAATYTSLAILLLTGKLETNQQLIALWLIFSEYSGKKPSKHPYYDLFLTISQSGKAGLVKDETANLAIAFLTEKWYTNTNGNIVTIGSPDIKSLSEKLAKPTQAYTPEKMYKEPLKFIKDLFSNTPIAHQMLFLEILTHYIDKDLKSVEDIKKNQGDANIIPLIYRKNISIVKDLVTVANENTKCVFCLIMLLLLDPNIDSNEQGSKPISELVKWLPQDEIYVPFIFFYYLFLPQGSNNSVADSAQKTYINFDVFQILREMIEEAKPQLSISVFDIFSEKILKFIQATLMSIKGKSQKFTIREIIPIISLISVKNKQDAYFINHCITRSNRECPEEIFTYLASIIDSGNAKTIADAVAFTRVPNKFVDLITHEKDIIATSLQTTPRAIFTKNALEVVSAICKYYPDKQDVFFKLFPKLYGSQPDESPSTVFYRYISEYLWSPIIAPAAASVLKQTIYHSAFDAIDFLDGALSNRFADITSIIENSSGNDSVIRSFISIARSMISFYFKYDSTIKEVPKFSHYIFMEIFPTIVHHHFVSKYKRWKTLTLLVSGAIDYADASPEFVEEANSNPSFISSLITIINVGANAVIIQEHHEKQQFDSADRTDIKYAVSCVAASLYFLQILLTRYLRDHKDTSKLCKVFFEEDSPSNSFFSTLISFLEVQTPASGDEETHPLAGYALRLIIILCEIAHRIGGISVDAFYPSEKQEILMRTVKLNLLPDFSSAATDQEAKRKLVASMINVLEFISLTLATQPGFAFAFGQTAVATIRSFSLAKNIDEAPEFAYALARLTSQLCLQLSDSSKMVQAIFDSKSSKMDDIQSIIYKQAGGAGKLKGSTQEEGDITKIAYQIAARAESLKTFVIRGGDNNPKTTDSVIEANINSLIEVIEKYLKPEQCKKAIDDKSIDFSRFRSDINRYGPDFYIQMDKFKFFFSRPFDQTKVFEDMYNRMVKYNMFLSITDALTNLVVAIKGQLKAKIDDNKMHNNKINLEMMMRIFTTALAHLTVPDSFITTFAELFSLVLQHNKSPFVFVGNNDTEFMEAVSIYLSKRSTPQVLNAITIILQRRLVEITAIKMKKKDSETIYTKSIPDMAESFAQLIRIIVKEKKQEAVACACEIAHQLIYEPFLLTGKYPHVYNEINTAIDKMSDETIAPLIMKVIVCLAYSPANGECLIRNGWAKLIASTKLPSGSPFWPLFFHMMSELVPRGPFVTDYIMCNLPTLIYFLDDTEKKQAEIPRLYMDCTHLVLSVFMNISTYEQLKDNDPTKIEILLTLIFTRMKRSVIILQDTSSANVDYVIATMRNCLLIFNSLIDPKTFPFGLPVIMQGAKALGQLKQIINLMASSILHLIERKEDYALRLSVLEMATRIYAAIIVSAEDRGDISACEGSDVMIDLIRKVGDVIMNIEQKEKPAKETLSDENSNQNFLKEMTNIMEQATNSSA